MLLTRCPRTSSFVDLGTIGVGNRVRIGHVRRAFHDGNDDAADGYRQHTYPERQHRRECEDIHAEHCFLGVDTVGTRQHPDNNRQGDGNQRPDQQCPGQLPQNPPLEPGWLAAVMQSLEEFTHRQRIAPQLSGQEKLSTENDASANDRLENHSITNFFGFDGGQVAVDQHQISQHP